MTDRYISSSIHAGSDDTPELFLRKTDLPASEDSSEPSEEDPAKRAAAALAPFAPAPADMARKWRRILISTLAGLLVLTLTGALGPVFGASWPVALCLAGLAAAGSGFLLLSRKPRAEMIYGQFSTFYYMLGLLSLMGMGGEHALFLVAGPLMVGNGIGTGLGIATLALVTPARPVPHRA